MADRRVRIYPGLTPESNVIGFSLSATDAPEDPRFKDFMEHRDYAATPVDPAEVPDGYVSHGYVEVRPPLTEDDLHDLGQLCLDVIDGGSNGVVVHDNRAQLPATPYDIANIITRQG